MDFSSLTGRFQEWKTEFQQALETGTSGPVAAGSQEWYTGLAVSPASFSQQLGDMQQAILNANQLSASASKDSQGTPAETGPQFSR